MHYFLILSDEFNSSNAVAIRIRYFYKALLQIHDPAKITVICSGRFNSFEGRVVTLRTMFHGSKRSYQRIFAEISFAISLARFFFGRKARKKETCIVFSIPFFLAALFSFPFLRWTSSKIVLDIRDSYPEAFVDAGIIKRGLAYKMLSAAAKQMLIKADFVVCATEGLREEIIGADNSLPTKVVTIFNGYPQSFRSVSSVKRDVFTCVFHGGLGYYANIEVIGKVAECLLDKGIDFVIIGAGAKEGQVKSLAERLSNVWYLGEIEHCHIPRVLSACHVGLALRKDGGLTRKAFPVKVWEFLGLGIPVIVSPECEAGVFLEKYGVGLSFNNSDHEAIAASILDLKNSPEAYNSMAASCDGILAEYTRESQAEKFALLVTS